MIDYIFWDATDNYSTNDVAIIVNGLKRKIERKLKNCVELKNLKSIDSCSSLIFDKKEYPFCGKKIEIKENKDKEVIK